MKKEMTFLATLALAVTLSPIGFAQQPDPSAQSNPSTQQPDPAQSPSTQPPDSSPTSTMPQQPSYPSPDASANPGTGQSAGATASSFTGKVVKAAGKYVLKSDGMNYQLDDQEKAKKFAGKQVTVNGDLDKSTSTIHVTDIAPAS